MLEQIRFENVTLQSGAILPYVDLVYKTFGKLNKAGDNCILLPTSFTTTHVAYTRLIGRARALNPAKYFIVVPNLLGNGVSSSPSTAAAPYDGAKFPDITIADNVQLQHRLLTEKLKVKQIALIYGWAMGATQAYGWASAYPAMIERLLTVCGSAKCWPLAGLRLQGAIAALKADCNFGRGNFHTIPVAGLRAVVCFMAGWAYSASFYRDQLYRNLGFETVEAMLQYAEKYYLTLDANDVLAVLSTWKNSLVELEELKNITAKAIIMPCDSDMYVSLDEVRMEAALIPHAELRIINSPYGHCAGAPGWVSADAVVIEQAIRDLLAR